jgi:hypothetical protein
MNPRVPRPRSAGPAELARRRAVMARDAGLRRISAVTRWVMVGVVGLSGALALIASHAFHGHTLANASSSTGAVSATQTPSSPATGLAPANQAPVATPVAPVVVSGGS